MVVGIDDEIEIVSLDALSNQKKRISELKKDAAEVERLEKKIAKGSSKNLPVAVRSPLPTRLGIRDDTPLGALGGREDPGVKGRLGRKTAGGSPFKDKSSN